MRPFFFVGPFFFTAPRFLEIVSEKTIIGKIYPLFSLGNHGKIMVYFADNAMIIQLQRLKLED